MGGPPRVHSHLLRFDRVKGNNGDNYMLADINGVVEGVEEITYGLNHFS